MKNVWSRVAQKKCSTPAARACESRSAKMGKPEGVLYKKCTIESRAGPRTALRETLKIKGFQQTRNQKIIFLAASLRETLICIY
jgi:hypothetical protein